MLREVSFSGSSLNLSARWPFGVSLVTTWLNLMMIGPWAIVAPGAMKTAIAIPARINLRMNSPPNNAETGFFGFPAFSSGSKRSLEQLDLSRIGEARHQAE